MVKISNSLSRQGVPVRKKHACSVLKCTGGEWDSAKTSLAGPCSRPASSAHPSGRTRDANRGAVRRSRTSVKGPGGELILQGRVQHVGSGWRGSGKRWKEMDSINYIWDGTCHLLFYRWHAPVSSRVSSLKIGDRLFPQLEDLCSREHILDVPLGLEGQFWATCKNCKLLDDKYLLSVL